LVIDPNAVAVERTIDSLGVGQIIYSTGTLDGSYILAPAPLDSVVVVVNRLTGKVEHRLHTGVSPIRVLLDPTGSRAYVANAEDDHVTVINLGDWSVRSLGEVDEPNGLALVP
jgi:DNA-binding beta-propeller fold protein YncE